MCQVYMDDGPLSDSSGHNQTPYGRLAGLPPAWPAPLGEIEQSTFSQGWHQAVQPLEQREDGVPPPFSTLAATPVQDTARTTSHCRLHGATGAIDVRET